MAQTFAAKVNAWVQAVPERQAAVFKGAVQKVVSAAQTPVGAGGNMPIRDGFLRASVAATLTGAPPPMTYKPKGAAQYAYNPAEVALVIASADVSDTILLAWTANYARHVHWGAQGRAPQPFLSLAAQRWPQFVAEAAAEAQASTDSR